MIIVKVPALLGEAPVEHPTAVRADRTENGALRLYAAEPEDASPRTTIGPLIGEYAPGLWRSWRVVEAPSRAERELQARVVELETQLADLQTDATPPDCEDEEADGSLERSLVRELRRDDTGAGAPGPAYLAHVDDRLLWLLRTAGREWGPLGVALAAAFMSDPKVVRSELKAARS